MSEEKPKRKRHHHPRPAQLTLEALRGQGFTACIVERYISMIHKRIDAFGYGDILAFKPDKQEASLLQACGAGEAKAHMDTALKAGVADWLRSPYRTFSIVEWHKAGERGKRKVWTGTVYVLYAFSPTAWNLRKMGEVDRRGRTLTTS